MRFRVKFGTDGWLFVIIACAFFVFGICNLHSVIRRDIAITIVILCLDLVFKKVFTYWELDSAFFRERRLWKVKEIPWQAITCVGSLTPGRSSPGFVTILCDDRAPMASRGRIVANPEDRTQFLATLRTFAPQAKFEV
jgi:hypothetical protein